MSFEEARLERRDLKQKLFQIRRFMEGERIVLDAELKRLKKFYEALEDFTDWSDFPEKWDIGDPNMVKAGSYGLTELDKSNAERKFGKSYETIIHLSGQQGE